MNVVSLGPRGARSVMERATSPKKVLACVGTGLTLLACARVVVLYVESYSAVRSERQADHELVRMCDAGTASLSVDFRALCLKKRSERSAPVLLKALLRACATAFSDFCESMSSPTKVVLLLLFCLTGVAAPVVKAIATLVVDHLRNRKRKRSKAHDSDSDDEFEKHQIVVVRPDRYEDASGASRLRRSVGRRITGPFEDDERCLEWSEWSL